MTFIFGLLCGLAVSAFAVVLMLSWVGSAAGKIPTRKKD